MTMAAATTWVSASVNRVETCASASTSGTNDSVVNATSVARSGAASTSSAAVDHGNASRACSPGRTAATKTNATGTNPVGTASAAPVNDSNPAFHAATARMVAGGAPSASFGV